jgi:predicted alpha/beta hydrolase family esterase
MKNAIIFHGTSCTPNSFWYPWLAAHLQQQGYAVYIPQLPQGDKPDLANWLPFALAYEHYNHDTILIGHSAGAPLILAILEQLNSPIDKAILVAGYARPKGANPQPEPILQAQYNWDKIKQNVKDITFINSDNDPWGCNDAEGYYMFQHLGGTLIMKHGEGHFGSDSFNQPYKEFPLLVQLI